MKHLVQKSTGEIIHRKSKLQRSIYKRFSFFLLYFNTYEISSIDEITHIKKITVLCQIVKF